jgi:plastocyanin
MIWRSAICFSLALFGLWQMPGLAAGGTVSGHVVLIDSSDSAVKKKKDYADVVVWLTPAPEQPVKVSGKRARMLQKDKMFTPHILVIARGTQVDFPNLDPIFHNAFSSFDGQVFDVALYSPGSSRSVQFNRTGIVRVFCNIHPFMSAIIVVVDSTYFTTSDRRGDFKIAAVPAGTYHVELFHERATPETLDHLKQTLVIPEGPLVMDPITVSEAGYLPTPHKNKYGRDYPAGSEKSDTYSGPLP